MSNERLYLPKEVAKMLDISTTELKDLCSRIPEIDRAVRRTSGGHRRYSADDIEALKEALIHKKNGWSYEQISDYLKGGFDLDELEAPRSRVEKKIDALIEQQSTEREMYYKIIAEMMNENKKLIEENRSLIKRHDNLLTTTINEKQQEKKSFFSRFFGN